MTLSEPKIKGLILCGGKSQRMGQDKYLMDYHGMPQVNYLYQLFNEMGLETYISCRTEQVEFLPENAPYILDSQENRGPSEGMLSAYEKDKNSSWLVVPCDVPFLNKNTLQTLLNHRNQNKIATAYKSPVNLLPEPIIAIWEPKGLELLKINLENNIKCPRKVLINHDIELIESQNPKELLNINTKEEWEKAME